MELLILMESLYFTILAHAQRDEFGILKYNLINAVAGVKYHYFFPLCILTLSIICYIIFSKIYKNLSKFNQNNKIVLHIRIDITII